MTSFGCVALLLGLGLASVVSAGPVDNCTNPYFQCSAHGGCTFPHGVNNPLDSHCYCDTNYITWPEDHYPECNYHQKGRVLPFVLEIFLGWFTGVGAFVCGQVGWGIGQLLLCWLGLLPFCLLGFIQGCRRQKFDCAELFVPCYQLLWMLAVVALEIATLVMIGDGRFKDENGAPMGDWS